ncbi:sirohydrochlorin ferrochelatase [Krasilnikovia cinnamomea]|uniref:Sirohydrochlorin ferrochelatase n=1 Tax=Krasilnikovia cinnamomea TaxID=349313 RepID=A0A4Q7ZIU9_9ACTN|nr:CbiX/SirB N-terminal domain-containing protein [Krasilnikovia cinnamomea]RZU50049.1 sirohydrochlorin ferrochelatase [Krasilnikovia cinnamomea]
MRPARLTPAVTGFAVPDGSARPGVVLAAHGSRDPRAAAATRALSRAVARLRPDWDVRAAYLDHSLPRPATALAGVAAAGGERAVLVPLLLTAAYHGRVDVPAEVAAARADGLSLEVAVAEVLGPVAGAVPPLLLDGLVRRLPGGPSTAGGLVRRADGLVRRADGLDVVVLAAAGTRDAAARETVEQVAAALGERLGLPCGVAYASASPPAAGEAVARLRAAGARRVGVASYFLAPGRLYDAAVRSARSAGAVAVAEPLTDAPELAELVVARAAEAAAGLAVAVAA